MATHDSLYPLVSARPARSVRATGRERSCALPGDTLIPNAVASLTHALTIRVPPRHVWPWLAQMGAGHRIVAELQHPAVGTIFPALPGETGGFEVLAAEPERSLVLGWRQPDGTLMVTWAFVLEPVHPGSTRLITRARGGQGYRFHGLPSWLARPIVALVHAVMERRQLLGIAERAEGI